MSNFTRQTLLRDDHGGQIVSWIPCEHAIVGKRIKLRIDENILSPTMQVIEVYQKQHPEAWIRERGYDWSRTRRASDI